MDRWFDRNYIMVVFYWSAMQSFFRCLDFINHLGLRFALDALQTSPVESLYFEANEALLNIIHIFNPAHPTLHLNALLFHNKNYFC